MTTKEVVESILKEIPKTRDDDFLLCLHTLIRLGHAHKGQTYIRINYKDLENAPAFETITRIRREIQNTEKRLKASEEVQSNRKKKEIQMHDYYATKSTRADSFPNSWMSA